MAYYVKSSAKADMIYNFIKDFTIQKGYPPTVREILADPNINIKSTASIKAYIDRLVDEGKLKKTGKKNRAIEIIGFSVLENTEMDTKSLNIATIPMLGNTAAGMPLYAEVENDTSYNLPTDYFSIKEKMFLLQVKGNSMIECGILDGDMVLIKSQNTAYNGQIIVAQIDNNEVTLKRYYNCGSYIKLKPENSSMDDIIITPEKNFKILGIATGLMRNHVL